MHLEELYVRYQATNVPDLIHKMIAEYGTDIAISSQVFVDGRGDWTGENPPCRETLDRFSDDGTPIPVKIKINGRCYSTWEALTKGLDGCPHGEPQDECELCLQAEIHRGYHV